MTTKRSAVRPLRANTSPAAPTSATASCAPCSTSWPASASSTLFGQSYDFYAALFEYLIKDYNKDNGGKYAEYYTPHAVATIMADILVPAAERGSVKNVTCYDPASGSGTLLMTLAHALGEDHCSIFSQDISQKSSSLLRLNLVLNKLVHSIPHIIQGNTILHPVHKDGKALRRFDYIVSNPPFKMDFSDFRDDLESNANTTASSPASRTYRRKRRRRWRSTSCSSSTSSPLETRRQSRGRRAHRLHHRRKRHRTEHPPETGGPEDARRRGLHAQQYLRHHRHQRLDPLSRCQPTQGRWC